MYNMSGLGMTGTGHTELKTKMINLYRCKLLMDVTAHSQLKLEQISAFLEYYQRLTPLVRKTCIRDNLDGLMFIGGYQLPSESL